MTDYGVRQRNDDGSWSKAEPLPMAPGLDVERYADGRWDLYRGHDLLASGRRRLVLWFALLRFRREAP